MSSNNLKLVGYVTTILGIFIKRIWRRETDGICFSGYRNITKVILGFYNVVVILIFTQTYNLSFTNVVGRNFHRKAYIIRPLFWHFRMTSHFHNLFLFKYFTFYLDILF